jgi:aminoglycoside phosphotransferase (APT) family kinase protein
MDSGTTTTSQLLLAALRQATGRADLDYLGLTDPLSGGFYAEMLRFQLVDPPDGLGGPLVARIVPDPDTGAWEATIQRYAAAVGFPTPAIRLTVGTNSPLGRYLIVMDHVDGQPPMAGLSAGAVATQLPALMRQLPGQLARIAAELHALDPAPLVGQLDALGTTIPATTAGFVEVQAQFARAYERPDIADGAERLLATQPRSSALAVTHGDLHPFNLLLSDGGPSLIDWTVGRVAHPAFTIGFTDLVLSHPPVPLPRIGAAVLGSVGRRLARNFLSTYRSLTDGTPAEVDEANLVWHRQVHALRILVELAGWDAAGTRPDAGHPWLVLEPIAKRELLGSGG